MMPDQGPPPVPEKLRMPLRIASVVVAYVIYRVLESRSVVGAVFVAAGFIVVDWVGIDYLTLRARERSGLLTMGSLLLGLGFIAVGILQVAR